MVLVTDVFAVLLGVVGDLNGRKQSSLGDDVLEVLQLASTLWPISFAAVVGPFLKTLALFKAERGATVGSLEFLLTGQTAISALKNLFILRYVKVWTMAIIAVWCLSPLGGQAIVRSLSLESNMESTEIPAAHYFSQTPLKLMDTGNLTGDINAFSSSYNKYPPIPDFRRRVMSALSGPDLLISHANMSNPGFQEAVSGIGGYPEASRLGRQDMWHNVRVPFMEYLDGYNANNPKNWTSVPNNEINPFSSFIGVPIRGGSHHRAGNSSMVLHSRYQTLECGDHLNGKDWTKAEGNPELWFHNNTLNKTELSGPPKPNALSEVTPKWPDTGTQPSLWLDFLSTKFRDDQLQLLVFGDCWEEPEIYYTGLRICNISTSYVDVEVECVRLDDLSDLKCQATRIRRSKGVKFSTLHSDLSRYEVAAGILYEMPSITATYDHQSPSVLEKYIRNPPTAFALEEDDINFRWGACYKDVPKRMFEARLTTALNTFIMASYNYTVLTGTDGTSLDQRNDMWQNVTATWTEYTDPVYTLHIGWYCISVVSTLILLACTFSNTLIRQIIIAPDFLDSVDGLIRDSPFVKITDEASDISTAVSARDRINFTKDMQIQIRDIQPDEDVGKIAITSDVIRSRLDPERVYIS